MLIGVIFVATGERYRHCISMDKNVGGIGASGSLPPLENRRVVFLSHCNPEENVLAAWYGAKLAAAGYEVWSDLTRLLGGEEMWRDIDEVLNLHARKVVVLLSRHTSAPNKEGARAELDRSHAMRKKLGDRRFVIPIKVDDSPFENLPSTVSNRTIIPTAEGHAQALAQVLTILEEDGVPRSTTPEEAALLKWQTAFLPNLEAVEHRDDLLLSNWLPVVQLPETVYLFDVVPPLTNPIGAVASMAKNHPLPVEAWYRQLVSFADLDDVQAPLLPATPIKLAGSMSLQDFLSGGTAERSLPAAEARKKISSLLRQSFECLAASRGLKPFALSEKTNAWWVDSTEGDSKVSFHRVAGTTGWRKLQGVYGRQDRTWHFGATGVPHYADQFFLRLTPHVIYTDPSNAKPPTASFRRAHCKFWFNAKWRDLLYAYVQKLADDDGRLRLPFGKSAEAIASCTFAHATLGLRPAARLDGASMAATAEDGDAEEVDTGDLEGDPAFVGIRENDEPEQDGG